MSNLTNLPDGTIVCFGYAAESDKNERASGGSTDQQERAVGERLERDDARTLVAFRAEDGFSGSKGDRGPKLSQVIGEAIAAADAGHHVELWAFHTSRFARGTGNKDEARSWIELHAYLKRHGVHARTVADDDHATNPVLVAIASEANAKYSIDLGANVRRGLREQAERGEWVGGHITDGYAVQRTVDDHGRVGRTVTKDPERRALWDLVWELAKAGWSTESIVTEINRRGWLTSPRRSDQKPRPFDASRLNRSLGTLFYAGLSAHRGEVVGVGQWEPYVSVEDFWRLRAERRERSNTERRRPGRPPELYLLAGIVRCGVCGGRMAPKSGPVDPAYRRSDGTRSRWYRCDDRQKRRKGDPYRCEGPTFDASVVDPSFLTQLPALLGDTDGLRSEVLAGRGAERERLTQVAQRARGEVAESERVLEKMAARLDTAVADDDEDAQELLLRAVKSRREELMAAQRRLDAALDALVLVSEVSPEEQQAAFYKRLHEQLAGRLDSARADVKQANVMLREFLASVTLHQTDDGVRMVPELTASAAARILRDVQRWPHGVEANVGGYPAEVVSATGATEGSELELVVRVPRSELDAAKAAIERGHGDVSITTPALDTQSLLTPVKTRRRCLLPSRAIRPAPRDGWRGSCRAGRTSP